FRQLLGCSLRRSTDSSQPRQPRPCSAHCPRHRLQSSFSFPCSQSAAGGGCYPHPSWPPQSRWHFHFHSPKNHWTRFRWSYLPERASASYSKNQLVLAYLSSQNLKLAMRPSHWLAWLTASA